MAVARGHCANSASARNRERNDMNIRLQHSPHAPYIAMVVALTLFMGSHLRANHSSGEMSMGENVME